MSEALKAKKAVGPTPARKMSLHYEPVARKDVDPEIIRGAGISPEDFVASPQEAWEIIADNDDLLGYGVIVRLPVPLDHVTEVAFFLGEYSFKYIPDLYYVVRDAIMTEVRKRHFLRIQSHIFADQERDIHFAQRLGFIPEGLLEGYGPEGRNMYVMRMAT